MIEDYQTRIRNQELGLQLKLRDIVKEASKEASPEKLENGLEELLR